MRTLLAKAVESQDGGSHGGSVYERSLSLDSLKGSLYPLDDA